MIEDAYVYDGKVVEGEDFEYTLEEGQSAELVLGSVKVNGELIDDAHINVEVQGRKVIVSTDYEIVEEGFGEDYLGSSKIKLNVNLSALGILVEGDKLTLKLIYGNNTLANIQKTLLIDYLEENVSNLSFVKLIPTIRIAKNGNYELNLNNYFEGAERYVFSSKNISFTGDNGILVLSPFEDFTGAVKGIVTGYSGNNSVESNEFTILVSSGGINISTSREKIKVGEPVKWTKKVNVEVSENVSVSIPFDAENVVVTKFGGSEEIVSDVINENTILEENLSKGITGNVVFEINSRKEFFLFGWAREIFRGVTGNVISEENGINSVETKEILLGQDSSVESYTIEYETSAPMAIESETSSGKEVVISGPDALHYTDVIASANISRNISIENSGRIKIYWKDYSLTSEKIKKVDEVLDEEVVEEVSNSNLDEEDIVENLVDNQSDSLDSYSEGMLITGNVISGSEENYLEVNNSEGITSNVNNSEVLEVVNGKEYVLREVPFDYYDLDGDGNVDYVEWVVPHLSNQTYQIIYITHAEELDSNRTFVRDIYNEVKARDDNWTTISAGNFVRVMFEINLTSSKDITLYARSNNSGRINVYEKDSDVELADFGVIGEDGKYRILLTNLIGEQDTFDLKVLNGSVEFDWIVDPTTIPQLTIITPQNNQYYSTSTVTFNASSNENGSGWYLFAPVSTPSVINNSLKIYYDFDSFVAPSKIVDLSPRKNNATNTSSKQTTLGKYGQGWYFDGTDDIYLSGSAVGISGSNSWSISIWFNSSSLAGVRPLFYWGVAGTLDLAIFGTSGTTPIAWSYSGCDLVGNNTLTTGTWYNMIATYNGSRKNLYINGAIVANCTATLSLVSTAVKGGEYTLSGGWTDYSGYQDELLIFNRTLTASEIASLSSSNPKTLSFVSSLDSPVYLMTSNATGTGFNFTNTSIPDGVYTVKFFANDTYGNINSTVAAINFTVDTVAPNVTVVNPLNQNYSTSVINFNVTTSENATCNYTITSGATNYTMTGNATGTGFGAVNSSVPDGQYTVRYYCADIAGNLNSSVTRAFGIDTVAPNVAILSPANQNYSTSVINFNVTTNENSTCNYTLNEGVTNYTMTGNATGIGFNATNSSVPVGQYTVRYYCADILGNLNDGATREFGVLSSTISSCGSYGTLGAYTLSQNISGTGTCITLEDYNNIEINCQGYTITYGTSAGATVHGIYGSFASVKNNITIKNCNIVRTNTSTAGSGIYAIRINASTIFNNTINVTGSSAISGINIGTTSGNLNISNNTIYTGASGAGTAAILTSTSDVAGLYIGSNQILSGYNGGTSGFDGISITAGYGAVVEYNNISVYGSGSNKGMYATGTSNANFTSNTLSISTSAADHYGIDIAGVSDGTRLVNNTISLVGTSTQRGINLGSNSISVINNSITMFATSAPYGISNLATYDNAYIYGNNVTVNGTNDAHAMMIAGFVDNLWIENNNFKTSGTTRTTATNGPDVVQLVSSASGGYITNITFKNNIINLSGKGSAIEMAGSGDFPYDIYFINNNIPRGEYLYLSVQDDYTGLYFYDQDIPGNYSFAGAGSTVRVENTSSGRIYFLNYLTGTGDNFSSDIVIGNNSAYVNSAQTGLNTSANVSLYGLRTDFSDPKILRNGVLCTTCYNFTSLNAGNVSFNVTGWSNYSIGDISIVPPVVVSVILNSSDGLNRTNESLSCYTNITSNQATVYANYTWYKNGTVNLSGQSAGFTQGTLGLVSVLGAGNTTKGDNWTCSVKAYDGVSYSDNWTNASLVILNSLPVVTLISPTDKNSTTNRAQEFTWSASDLDGDSLGYQITLNSSSYMGSPPVACSENILTITSSSSFTPSSDLSCLYDNGYVYNWSVRANDSEGYGAWSGIWSVNITASLAISFVNSNVAFGVLSLLEYNDTTSNNPTPFIIQNDGNVFVNTSLNGTSLWENTPNPSRYFKFKIDNNTFSGPNELGAFNWANSLTSWTNVSTSLTTAITSLNYSDAKDSAEIDIYVEVPSGESSGSKSSIITFNSILGE
ncbi:MAG: LamG domain-containing protein [Nanoarchaeota archaeon]